MDKQITLIKNNDKKDWSDLEWVKEFYDFLQGKIPEQLSFAKGHRVKLTQNKAFAIIYYLQEHFPLLPDQIEKCYTCGELYDSYLQGHYSELTLRNYCCESCEPRGLYEREQKAEKRAAKKLNTNQ